MPEIIGSDPVCGMEIEPTEAAGSSSYEGQTYYFCSNECKQKFDSNPSEYADYAA